MSRKLAWMTVGVAACCWSLPSRGKNHTTINNDLGLADDRPTQEMWGFLSGVLKK
jgi:hypothetical protein